MTASGKNAEDVLDVCARCYLVTTILNMLLWLVTVMATRLWCGMRQCCLRCVPLTAVTSLFYARPLVLEWCQYACLYCATVAQLNAEALSALAYTQVIRRGCPAIYGHYLSTVSMQSGAPMAGTPEISLMNFMIGQMARYYDVPWRTSNTLGGQRHLMPSQVMDQLQP